MDKGWTLVKRPERKKKAPPPTPQNVVGLAKGKKVTKPKPQRSTKTTEDLTEDFKISVSLGTGESKKKKKKKRRKKAPKTSNNASRSSDKPKLQATEAEARIRRTAKQFAAIELGWIKSNLPKGVKTQQNSKSGNVHEVESSAGDQLRMLTERLEERMKDLKPLLPLLTTQEVFSASSPLSLGPMQSVKKEVKKCIQDWMAQFTSNPTSPSPSSPFPSFVRWAFQQFEDLGDYSGSGLLFLLQVIVSEYPSTIVKELRSVVADVTVLRTKLGGLYLWFIAQFLYSTNISISFRVWFDVVFPMACSASVTDSEKDILLSYLDALLDSRHDLDSMSLYVATSFEKLMLLRFSRANNANVEYVYEKKFKGKLLHLHDKPTASTSKIASRFFSIFLKHAASQREALRKECLRNLVESLKRDSKACMEQWKRNYKAETIAQSNNLILYLMIKGLPSSPSPTTTSTSTGNGSSPSTPTLSADLLEALQFFEQTNNQLLEASKTGGKKASANVNDVRMCNVTCEAMRKKLGEPKAKSSGFLFVCIFWLFVALFLVAIWFGKHKSLCSELQEKDLVSRLQSSSLMADVQTKLTKYYHSFPKFMTSTAHTLDIAVEGTCAGLDVLQEKMKSTVASLASS